MTENSRDKWCWTRISEAYQKNKNDTYKCLSEILQIILETLLVFLFFIFENIFGIVLLLLGIIYLNDCPIRNSIPYSVITFGSFSVIHGITILVIRYKLVNIENPNDGFATLAKLILCVSSVATFIAFIWVCFAVYGVFSQVNTSGNGSNSCNFYLYWVSFVFITICLVFVFVLLMLLCCLLCCAICCGANVNFAIIKRQSNV